MVSNYHKVLEIIEDAIRNNSVELDLSDNGLRKLPPEIGQLRQLQSLNLISNQLKELPPQIVQLSQLQSLSLSNNQLSDLPPEIVQLSQLQSLDLRGNKLRELPPEIVQLSQLQSLSLNGNQLGDLSPEIVQLSQLQSLDLSNNWLRELPPEIVQLRQLQSLDLSGNELSALPSEIVQLSQLQSLFLSDNGLSDLPPEIGQLSQLQSLDLSFNGLSDLPSEIVQLSQLQSLDLSGNELSALPPEIVQLRQLQSLDLSGNELSALPSEIGELSQLQSLFLSHNELSDLPSEIGQLRQLQSLFLSSNGLRELPPEIGQLSQLQSLYLSFNGLRELPPEIGQLSQLQSLDLWGNGLSDLPPEIVQLSQLQSLDLSNNQLSDLPPEIVKLSQLQSLDLRGNQLSVLPPEIVKLSQLQSLSLRGNGLGVLPPEIVQLSQLQSLDLSSNGLGVLPPEIVQLSQLQSLDLWGNPLITPPNAVVDEGIDAIRDYFIQLESEGMERLYEAKLLILGEAGAGKTTLAKKILNPDYELKKDEDTTKGIDIHEWEFDIGDNRHFKVNIWDFGGQEIYHATHQFFLTQRSLYALVVDQRREDTDFDYWLNIAGLLGGESPLVIVNNEKQDRHREINERGLRGQFLNFKEIFRANFATNHGLEGLLKGIKRYMESLPHIGTELPKTWVDIRRALEKNKRNYIHYSEYLQICQSSGLAEERYQDQILGYLHDIGVCLHFKEDALLRDYVILKTEWGTDAVYKVLDNPQVIANWGRFTHANLRHIWQDAQYKDMRTELLQLMINFQLCYQIPNSQTYIAPQLLPLEEPSHKWQGKGTLRLRYRYEFMPKGIITRLIVALHDLIERELENEMVWRSGMIIQWEETRAEIVEYYSQRGIHIRLQGRDKKSLLAIIRREIARIHDSFYKLKVDELIPCNCSVCSKSSEPEFYPYKILKQFAADGKSIQCRRRPYEMVDARALIDDVIIISQTNETDKRKREPSQEFHFHMNQIQSQTQENIMKKETKIIRIGNNNTITAPIVIADHIENSFNMLQESSTDEDVKALLTELLETINAVVKELPDEQQDDGEAMARDAEILVKEATSSKPRRKWYDVSIEGLTEAAKNIGKLADPVLAIVAKLIPFLLP